MKAFIRLSDFIYAPNLRRAITMVDELNSQAVSNNLESSLPGMPPQNTQPAPQTPGQFDFMLKDQPKPPGRLGSMFSGIPKPAKITITAVGALVVLIILYSLFFGGKTTNSDQFVSVMARAQEIARVSDLVNQQTKNADALSLATTASTTISSQEAQLKAYLKSQKIKVDSKLLLSKLDKTTDKQLDTALQNNNYEQTYYDYLKISLASYQTALDSASTSSGPNGKAVLSAAQQSVQTLLSAPQLK